MEHSFWFVDDAGYRFIYENEYRDTGHGSALESPWWTGDPTILIWAS
jgi:hypothetical protein